MLEPYQRCAAFGFYFFSREIAQWSIWSVALHYLGTLAQSAVRRAADSMVHPVRTKNVRAFSGVKLITLQGSNQSPSCLIEYPSLLRKVLLTENFAVKCWSLPISPQSHCARPQTNGAILGHDRPAHVPTFILIRQVSNAT